MNFIYSNLVNDTDLSISFNLQFRRSFLLLSYTQLKILEDLNIPLYRIDIICHGRRKNVVQAWILLNGHFEHGRFERTHVGPYGEQTRMTPYALMPSSMYDMRRIIL